MTLCNWCEVKIDKQSYFISINEGMKRTVIEVCPECHHYKTYGTEEQLENYKRRMNIK